MKTELLAALACLLTYAAHSTLWLGSAWLLLKGPLSARASARPALRERVWKLALLGGIFSTALQASNSVQPLTGRWLLEPATAENAAEPRTTDGERATRSMPPRFVLLGSPLPQAVSIERQTEATNAPEHLPIGSFEQRVLSTLERPEPQEASPLAAYDPRQLPWAEIALGVWILGSALGLLLLACAWSRLRDLLAGRAAVRSGELPRLLAALRRRAGYRREVRLTSSPHIRSPLSLGVLFPQICIPERALTDLGEDEAEAMLAHELAHLVRRDPTWLLFGRALAGMFFFQPLHRVACRELEEAAELLCDERAVEWTGKPLGLARCLTEVAGWSVSAARRLPPLPTGIAPGMATTRSGLRIRVQRLLQTRSAQVRAARSGRWSAASCAIWIGVALLAPGFAATSPTSPTSPIGPIESAGTPPATSNTPTPASAPTPTPATPGAELRRSLDGLIEALDEEIDFLEAELADLRAELEAAHLLAELGARLEPIEQRARSLRERRERLEELLPRLPSHP